MTAAPLGHPTPTRPVSALLVMAVAVVAALLAHAAAAAGPALPEIRLSRQNAVPRCVTPERLMAFLGRRNGQLSPRFRDIARYYKQHGEAWGVRWDYAFFQMAIETNFLTYRAPSGRMGDVDPRQNNFAGIGTTGGGVPGDSFPDVSTGVLAQIQHLVVYSGEMIPNPVAPRTQLKQDHILAKSRELDRPVRFSDLARRWAADPKYGRSIEWVAERFRTESCKRNEPPQKIETLPWQDTAPRRSAEDPDPPVRTVWSRSEARTAGTAPAKTSAGATVPAARAEKAAAQVAKTAAKAGRASADAAAAASPPAAQSGEGPAERAPAGGKLVAGYVLAEPAAQGGAAQAAEPETRFAMFNPPAALASATAPVVVRTTAAGLTTMAGTRDADRAEPEPEARPQPVEVQAPPHPEPLADVPATASSDQKSSDQTSSDQKSRAFDPPSGLGVKPGRCLVETARYGGETTVLVKSPDGGDIHFIALSVIDGFEDSMTANFLASRAEGGDVLGTFPTQNEALAKARSLCPD